MTSDSQDEVHRTPDATGLSDEEVRVLLDNWGIRINDPAQILNGWQTAMFWLAKSHKALAERLKACEAHLVDAGRELYGVGTVAERIRIYRANWQGVIDDAEKHVDQLTADLAAARGKLNDPIYQECCELRVKAEQQSTRLKTALEEAGEAIHSEYCGIEDHIECLKVVAALADPPAQRGGPPEIPNSERLSSSSTKPMSDDDENHVSASGI